MSSKFIRYYAIAIGVILALTIVQALCCQRAHAKEKLTYDISVLSANVARAVMVYKPDKHGGERVLKLYGTLETKENWDKFYSVHHNLASVIAPDDFPILSEMDLNKNKSNKQYVIYFGSEGIAGSKKVKGKKEKFISEQTSLPTHDLLSWINYLRSVEYEEGKSFSFRIFSGNHFYNVECLPVKIEDVWTKRGIIPAYKINATISGVGKKKKFNKKVRAWISADKEKLPLKMIFGLTFGEIRVILTNVS